MFKFAEKIESFSLFSLKSQAKSTYGFVLTKVQSQNNVMRVADAMHVL